MADRRRLTHVDSRGRARMVDVGGKTPTDRRAVAEARVLMTPGTARKVRAGKAAKGDVLATARIAGVLAAKRTPDLIPLCHTLSLSDVAVEAEVGRGGVHIRASARAMDRTGVEMEAMVAAAVAALTVYDMVKGHDRSAEVTGVRLLEKSGGKSGPWRRPSASRS
jgi:cyclic pyranopterin phosphate synthase